MKGIMKKSLAIALSLLMLLSVQPLDVFASGGLQGSSVPFGKVNLSGGDPDDKPTIDAGSGVLIGWMRVDNLESYLKQGLDGPKWSDNYIGFFKPAKRDRKMYILQPYGGGEPFWDVVNVFEPDDPKIAQGGSRFIAEFYQNVGQYFMGTITSTSMSDIWRGSVEGKECGISATPQELCSYLGIPYVEKDWMLLNDDGTPSGVPATSAAMFSANEEQMKIMFDFRPDKDVARGNLGKKLMAGAMFTLAAIKEASNNNPGAPAASVYKWFTEPWIDAKTGAILGSEAWLLTIQPIYSMSHWSSTLEWDVPAGTAFAATPLASWAARAGDVAGGWPTRGNSDDAVSVFAPSFIQQTRSSTPRNFLWGGGSGYPKLSNNTTPSGTNWVSTRVPAADALFVLLNWGHRGYTDTGNDTLSESSPAQRVAYHRAARWGTLREGPENGHQMWVGQFGETLDLYKREWQGMHGFNVIFGMFPAIADEPPTSVELVIQKFETMCDCPGPLTYYEGDPPPPPCTCEGNPTANMLTGATFTIEVTGQPSKTISAGKHSEMITLTKDSPFPITIRVTETAAPSGYNPLPTHREGLNNGLGTVNPGSRVTGGNTVTFVIPSYDAFKAWREANPIDGAWSTTDKIFASFWNKKDCEPVEIPKIPDPPPPGECIPGAPPMTNKLHWQNTVLSFGEIKNGSWSASRVGGAFSSGNGSMTANSGGNGANNVGLTPTGGTGGEKYEVQNGVPTTELFVRQ